LVLVSRHVVPPPADWSPHHQVTGYLFDDDSDFENFSSIATCGALFLREIYVPAMPSRISIYSAQNVMPLVHMLLR
jgi:hypothetical protein